jgi:hypothetical protein
MKQLSLCIVFLLLSATLLTGEEPVRIDGPRTADGRIDYLKAAELRFYPKELATDDNGFRLFVRQFGLNEAEEYRQSEFNRNQTYEKLGLDPKTKPTLLLPREPRAIMFNFFKAEGNENFSKRLNELDRPWTLEQLPMLADWVEEMDSPLNALAEMIRKPVFYAPFLHSQQSVVTGEPDNLTALTIPDAQLSRSIARLYQARAMYRAGKGDIDGAIEDTLTVHRLGRLVASNRGTIALLVGIAIEGMATAMLVGANPEHPFTEKQLRRILEGLDTLPPRAFRKDTYEFERLFALSIIQDVAAGKKNIDDVLDVEIISPVAVFLLKPFVDWNIVYRRVNEVYDALQEPPPLEKFHAMLEEAEQAAQDLTSWQRMTVRLLVSHKRFSNTVGNGFIAVLVPMLDMFEEAARRLECSENMQRLALAILLYQCEHGKLPDGNWGAKIEKYLGKNPEQYFSCPTNPSPKGLTAYALVRYADTTADTVGDTVAGSRDVLLLVELRTSVPFDKAVLTPDEVLERSAGSLHPGGMNVALRSSAVRFQSSYTSEPELRRLLGLE